MGDYSFDGPIERRGTGSIKWSGGELGDSWLPYPIEAGSPQDASMIPMWLADMDFATAPEVVAALRERIEHGVFGYGSYTDEFFEAAADWLESHHGWQPRPDWILPNSGVMPAINLAIQTFSEPGDGVIVQPPVFGPIPEAAELNRRRVIASPLVLEHGRYQMDLADLAIKASDPRAKVMILCNPHNPVGRAWSAADLAEVAKICAKHDIVLVSDEIHADLTYAWADFASAGVLSEHRDRVVVCTGPSKAFNLPGLKLSLTIIPNESLRAAYRSTLNQQNELWGANVLGATALEAAYRQGNDWLLALKDYLADNLDLVEEFLAERIPRISVVRPDALYLLWIDCQALGLSDDELDLRLRAAGVWLERGSAYGAAGSGFMRMTIATPRPILEEALSRMEVALAAV